MASSSKVAEHIVAAFRAAHVQFPALHEQWIQISFKFGKFLPESLLMLSVQKIGELDLVLRSMEDSLVNEMKRDRPPELFTGHYLMFFSQQWIASTYEVVRLLKDRQAISSAEFDEIYRLLTLVRVPLEKHEIAVERHLKEPVVFVRVPQKGDVSDFYAYTKTDNKRSVILPSGFSKVGSAMWNVPDIRNDASLWLDRRDISDRLLQLDP